jgi:transglutaminase-like putative cysteine protease
MGAAGSSESATPPGEEPAPDAFSRLEKAGTADDHGGADHVIVYSEAINKVKPSGVTYVDGYDLTKILTTSGCRDRGVLTWHYDPQSSYVEVREVNVIRDGERVEVVTYRKGFTYALLAAGGGAAGGAEAPDDDRYIPPMPGEYFDIVLFVDEAPIIEKRYVLRVPVDKRLHSEIYNGALYSSTTYTDEYTEFAWWGLDLPARVHEPRQPDASDFAPKVVMATAESWEAKSRWFFDVNREQFEVTPAIQAKVDEIIANEGLEGADDERKAKALVHWVAQNIRYSGQTMGEGEGFTLHPGDMIFEQRSGVCKDIAGMLITMMRAAGMDSYAAMTMAGSRIDEVPADQFNHCVTALKLEDGSYRMYDPTWVPYNNAIWSYSETEQHYLVGSPEGETLSRIRYSPAEESPLEVSHEANLDGEGNLKGTLEMHGSGAMDGRLRRMVNGVRRRELDARAAGLLSVVSPRVQDVSVTSRVVDDFSGDMWIRIEYSIPKFAQPVAGGYEFTSPMMAVLLSDGNLFGTGGHRWGEERQTDLMLWYTQQVDATETISLPGGLKLQGEPTVDEVDETYAAFAGTATQNGSKLTVTQRGEIRRRQIPPDGYEGFVKAMTAARTWGDQVFRVAKEEK